MFCKSYIVAALASALAVVNAQDKSIDLEKVVSTNYDQLREKLSPLIEQFKELDRPDYEKLTSAMGGDTLPEKFDEKMYENIESAFGGQSRIFEMMSVLGLEQVTEGLDMDAGASQTSGGESGSASPTGSASESSDKESASGSSSGYSSSASGSKGKSSSGKDHSEEDSASTMHISYGVVAVAAFVGASSLF